jgi:hypothetical protein
MILLDLRNIIYIFYLYFNNQEAKVYKYKKITFTIILKWIVNAQRELTERPRLVDNFLIKVFKIQYENVTRLITP